MKTVVAPSDMRSPPAAPRLVGLIPAAGRATRLGRSPCSKELLPIGFAKRPYRQGPRPKAVSEYLLEQMVRAGCHYGYFVLREGKWDIPGYFGSGAEFGFALGYLLVEEPWGPPFTLGKAAPFVSDSLVVTGFPDILIDPPDAMLRVVEHLRARPTADLVLGTFPADARSGADWVLRARPDRVEQVVPKEAHPQWSLGDCTWAIAAWRPRFTRFLAAELARLRLFAEKYEGHGSPEWPVGAVIAAALDAGMEVRARHFPDGAMLDIGLAERLMHAQEFPGVWDGCS